MKTSEKMRRCNISAKVEAMEKVVARAEHVMDSEITCMLEWHDNDAFRELSEALARYKEVTDED